jgi:hypothetical protein
VSARKEGFWPSLLSPQTARFILAQEALLVAAGGAFYLMSGKVPPANSQAATFALGALFGYAAGAYNYYFGSTARNDERPVEARIVNPRSDPAQTHETGGDTAKGGG